MHSHASCIRNEAVSDPRRLRIVFSPDSARRVSNYVVRGFFGYRELPQALARMLFTEEFALFVGVPFVLLVAARLVSDGWFSVDTEMLSPGLTSVAVIWLVAGLLRISRYGPSSGIGCYLVEPDGSLGPLIGGLRMRLERRHRRIWIAGLLVEPKWRGAGISTALMQAAFLIAQKEAANGPVTISVFAPSHPASKAIIARHLGGMQTLQVSDPATEILLLVFKSFRTALSQSKSEFQWDITGTKHNLFHTR
jgi:GNAT superfamily N-acetyltransferase